MARLLLLTGALLLTGCHGGAPHLPEDWPAEPTTEAAIVANQNAPQIQIFCCYGPWVPSHTTLRLVRPGKDPIFWDPGGYYGEVEEGVTRKNDLIVRGRPGMDGYMAFRQGRGGGDSGFEIFIFELPEAVADRLATTLLQGTDDKHPKGQFSPQASGMFCCVEVSDFLNRFAQDSIPVSQSYFLPHSLANELYTLNPTRVVVWRRGEGFVVARPPR